MALELYIPPCILDPPYDLHPPPPERPLRIQIEGPLVSIEKLFPAVQWKIPLSNTSEYFQPAGPMLAALTYKHLYGREADDRADASGDLVIRDEYLGWIRHERGIDYYGVTFDHLVPADDADPEVLQINIIETEEDDRAYANKYLLFPVDAKDYTGKKVLAVLRCCQKRKGTQDRGKVNDLVRRWEARKVESQNT
ncbi:hypothetical protein LY78DRAFT_595120 [Colletotrichum sublineola]|uniref:Uncharacterized protein n=1 Tax=Colletotrichum sublineola TaxID=1173701 RepID=A0A066XA15_COLSU|nr:hypothetical protein LY78DRAFT_595120 [Colletotrichum sublineola]KDN65762.1 hypothetical protein CSUB01_12618 [Colletotrichum sublineola]